MDTRVVFDLKGGQGAFQVPFGFHNISYAVMPDVMVFNPPVRLAWPAWALTMSVPSILMTSTVTLFNTFGLIPFQQNMGTV